MRLGVSERFGDTTAFTATVAQAERHRISTTILTAISSIKLEQKIRQSPNATVHKILPLKHFQVSVRKLFSYITCSVFHQLLIKPEKGL